jgi:hypothetical protein
LGNCRNNFGCRVGARDISIRLDGAHFDLPTYNVRSSCEEGHVQVFGQLDATIIQCLNGFTDFHRSKVPSKLSLGILNVMALMRHFTAQHVDHTLDDFEMFRMNLVVLCLGRWWTSYRIFRRQVVNIYYSIFKHSTSSHGVYSINWVSTLPFVSPYLNSVIIDHIK